MQRIYEQDRGAWMQTFSKGLYYPSDPRVEEVNIIDIAHALSRICRYGGHVSSYYSVAQHSVLVSKILPEELKLWGLLHDAAEAYVGDVIRPVKHGDKRIEEVFCALEDRNLAVILSKWGLEMPMPPEVRIADDTILTSEIRDLMDGQHVSYGLCDTTVTPTEERILPWPMDTAKMMFMARYKELTGAEQ